MNAAAAHPKPTPLVLGTPPPAADTTNGAPCGTSRQSKGQGAGDNGDKAVGETTVVSGYM